MAPLQEPPGIENAATDDPVQRRREIYSQAIDSGLPKEFALQKVSDYNRSIKNAPPIKDLAAQVAGRLGVPAEVIYAQWAHETGDFTNRGARSLNNLAGIKTPDLTDYRQFGSPSEFADYYASYIQRKYPAAIGAQSIEQYASALKAGGYFEDSLQNYEQGMTKRTEEQGGIPPPPAPGIQPGSPQPVQPTDTNVLNRRLIYGSTLEEGQDQKRALQRVHEYNYGIKQGMNDKRALEFALSKQYRDTPKKILTDEEKQNLAQTISSMSEEDRKKQFIFYDDPRKWAEGYAEAKARGMNETDAVEYASGNSAQKSVMRGEQWLAPKWTGVKSGFLKMLGVSQAEERADNPIFMSDEQARASELRNYVDVSHLDQRFGRAIGSVDLHVRHLIESFTTPDMVAIEAASFGMGGLARGTLAVGAEAEEANVATRLLQRAARAGGQQLGKTVARSGQAEEGIAAAERAEKAIEAVRTARVPVSVQRTVRTVQRLAHAGFTIQMAQGTVEAGIGATRKFKEGDIGEGLGYVLDGLVSGAMVGGGILHAEVENRLHIDLDAKTREVYGQPEAAPSAPPALPEPAKARPQTATDKEIVDLANFQMRDLFNVSRRTVAEQPAASQEGAWIRDHLNDPDALRKRFGFESPEERAAADKEIQKAAKEAEKKAKAEAPKKVTKFGNLNDQQQAVVINKLIEDDPKWKLAADATQEQAKKAAVKINRRYNEALQQAWNPNAASRAIGMIHEERYEGLRKSEIGKLVAHIREQVERRTKEIREDQEKAAKETAEETAARIDARAERRREDAAKRAGGVRKAGDVAEARAGSWEARQETHAAVAEVPGETRRVVEAQVDPQGHETYPATYWGQGFSFGVRTDGERHSVYMTTERDGKTVTEWLDREGNFSESPESLYYSTDANAAKTVAQLSSLLKNAEGLAGEEGTEEQKADYEQLLEIQNQLASGETSYKDAQKQAGIAPKPVIPDIYTAGLEGKINGPYHEQTPAEYAEDVETQLRAAGYSEEEIQATMDSLSETARAQTENNLNHVIAAGDYVVSKRGVTWTLNQRGLLVPSDGGAPVPLMKNGLYSNQAFQLASSGRVGYGSVTAEQRIADNLKRSEIAEAIRQQKEDFARELRLSYQNVGLETIPAESEQVPYTAGQVERRAQFLDKPPVPGEVTEARRTRRMAYKASKDPDSIINKLATRYNVSTDEIMRLGLAGLEPQTAPGKVADLEVGDIIHETWRGTNDWVVEQGAGGVLRLRSGARTEPLDRLNPSSRVLRIIDRAKVEKVGRDWTAAQKKYVAFEKQYKVHQHFLAEGVRDRMDGKVVDPPPRNQAEADAQAEAATSRHEAAHGEAVDAAIDAQNPTGTAEQAKEAAQKAEEAKKVAEEAAAQKATAVAKALAAGKGPFPERAPVSRGLRGNAGTIDQNNRKFPFHYELVAASDLVTSHVWDGSKLVRNEAFPRPLQPREPNADQVTQRLIDAQLYSESRDANGNVRTSGYNFDKYSNRTIDAMSGPALIEPGGRVVSGNGRIQRLMKHIEILSRDPESSDASLAGLRARMRTLAQEVGITDYPEEDGKSYVVVRMLDKPIETLEQASELGLLFNESEAESIDNAGHASVYARTFTEDTVSLIGRELETVEGSLDEIMRAKPDFFAQLVARQFGIPDSQRSAWFGRDRLGNHVLTEKGRKLFAQSLMHYMVGNADALRAIENEPAGRAFVRAIGPMVRMRVMPDMDITGKVMEALEAARQTASANLDRTVSRDPWDAVYNPSVAHLGFMEGDDPPEPDRMVETIYRALIASKAANPRIFADRMKKYLEGEKSQVGLWGSSGEGGKEETAAERFSRVFAPELKQVTYRREKKDEARPITDEEFKEFRENRPQTDEQKPVEQPPEAPAAEVPYPEFYADLVRKLRARGLNSNTPVWDKAVEEAEAEYEKTGKLAAEPPPPTAAAPPPVAPLKPEAAATLFPGVAPPPTPKTTAKSAERRLGELKAERGYITPPQLLDFLQNDPATKKHAQSIFRYAHVLAKFVWKRENLKEQGVEEGDALGWVLQRRVAGLGRDNRETAHRGVYLDPRWEKGMAAGWLNMFQAADASTFVHEFFHVVFPYLSDADLHAIDSIGERRVWDGDRDGMTHRVYDLLSEKLAHGGERFMRDENPADFTKDVQEVKGVLAKIKDMLREVYLTLAKDPLAPFRLSSDARQFFSKMFHVVGFDRRDDFEKDLREAHKKIVEEKKTDHPLVTKAKEMNAQSVVDSRNYAGGSIGLKDGKVSPIHSVVMVYSTLDDAVANIGELKDFELIEGKDGTFGIRLNADPEERRTLPGGLPGPPKAGGGALFQPLPEKHPGVQLEELEAKLRATPPYKMLDRKLLEIKIANLRNEIRARYDVEPRAPQPAEPAARDVLKERNAGTGNRVRTDAHGVSGIPEPPRARGLPEPPVVGKPRDAATAEKRGGAVSGQLARPTSLKAVREISLEPLANPRGAPVGLSEGEAFDEKKWKAALKSAGLPETLPPPTVYLSPEVADKLIYPGQKASVLTALSALEQGDGVILGNATGSGKTYLSGALIREFQNKNPNARILYVTRNGELENKTAGVAKNSFGFEVDSKRPKDQAVTGVYSASYADLINDAKKPDGGIYNKMKWDLVVADESGEARNWFEEDNQQGKRLMEVMRNSRKGVYMSATPFHSPMEYGYLEKLNLWKPGQFDKWIEQNFTQTADGKVRLAPEKQAKLRQQLVERGQFVSQAISYDGFEAHFGVVPVTVDMKIGLNRIREGFNRARAELIKRKRPALAEKLSAFEATYVKNFLERQRLPQAIELAKKALAQGWHVGIFSENSSEDLFRRSREDEDPSTYQELDDAMGGQLSRIIPPFPNVYDELKKVFGDDIGDYSGRGNSLAERKGAISDFLKGIKRMIYTTYAAGGIGVDMHDADYPDKGIKGGDKPRFFIYLGPPYSGVLLEQAMGRPWRFGVKSNVISVILGTDSEPDVKLMTHKIGPRMKALRAAVLGEKDSLADAMATYSDEEKTRERQDMLAYAEGDEVKVDANSFNVRSKKRDVGIQDWSAIQVPSAETAKNKGMKYGEEVPGGDWSTLYQDKYALYEPPTPEEAAADKVIDSIGNGAAETPGVQNLDPAERDTAVGMAAASASQEVRIPVDRDKDAVARQSMQAGLNMPGDRKQWVLTFPEGKQFRKGVWVYRGDPNDLKPTGEMGPSSPLDIHVRHWYPSILSMEQSIVSMAHQAGVREVGKSIVRIARSLYRDRHIYRSQFLVPADKIASTMAEHKLDVHNPKVFNEVWDVVEGFHATGDPNINAAAEEIRKLNQLIKDEAGKGGVETKLPSGAWKPFSKQEDDPNFMPHKIDWDADVRDPLFPNEVHKLRDLTGGTIGEEKKARLVQALVEAAKKNNPNREITANDIVDYLNEHKEGVPFSGHMHRARVMNFPIIKKDWATYTQYLQEAADSIAIAKNIGVRDERTRLNAEIAKIPSVNGRASIKKMFDVMLEPQDWTGWSAKVYGGMMAYESFTKMPLSAVKVPWHLVHAGMNLGKTMPVAKALGQFVVHPRELIERGTYLGTLARQVQLEDIIGEGGIGKVAKAVTHEVFKRTGFEMFYRWGRAIAGESARIYMDQYAMNDLRKGGKRAEEAKRVLKDTLLIGDKAIDDAVTRGQWDPEDVGTAQVAFANATMFSDNPLQMPAWSRLEIRSDTPSAEKQLNRALRLTYSLQSFSLKTTSLLKEKLFDEVVHHKNYKPLAYFLIAYPIVGALLRGTGAGAKGLIQAGVSGARAKLGLGGQTTYDSWTKYIEGLREIEDHPALGFLHNYIDDLTAAIAWDRTRRFATPLLYMAEGEKAKLKKAGQEWQYFFEDEVEQDLGPAWNTLVAEPLLTVTHEGAIAVGSKGTPEQRHAHEAKTLYKFFLDEIVLTKEDPQIQEWLKNTKPKAEEFYHFKY